MPGTRLGCVAPRHASEIAASPLGVGFECLDRRMFDPDRVYDRVSQLGVKWARVQTGWSRCETVEGEYDFAWLDEIVDNLLKRDVQPWFNLGYGNQVYIPDAPTFDAVGWAPIFTERARTGWQHYVAALAEHFADRVKHWEVWNEANARGNFWRPKDPDAGDYAWLVRLSAEAVRPRVPEAKMIGGVVCTGLRARTMRFIEDMLEAGVGDQLDAVSYHPYYWNPDEGDATYFEALRDLVQRYNASLELWQGESGGNNQPGQRGAMHMGPWTQTIHAKWTARRTLVDLRNGAAVTSYFHISDFENYVLGGAEGKAARHGLLTGPDYEPTQAYFTYQCLGALFDRETVRDKRCVVYPPGRGLRDSDVDDSRSELEHMALRWAGFARNGRPMWAFWMPTDVFREDEPPGGPLVVWAPKALPLESPVLIDPLDQSVYELSMTRDEDGAWHCDDPPPRLDHPLIITDRSVLELDR